jgi:hypothetical protein
MDGNDDLRLRPVIDLADLLAAGMAGGMDERIAVGDHLGTEIHQGIDDRVHRPLVSRDGSRGEDNAIPRRERNLPVVAGGDPRQGRPRLSLAARHQRDDPVARQIAVGVLVKEGRQAVQVAELRGYIDGAADRTADNHDVPAGALRGLRDGAHPRHVGRE